MKKFFYRNIANYIYFGIILLALISENCLSTEQKKVDLAEIAKLKGHPIFLRITKDLEKSGKQISIRIVFKNLSDSEKIRSLKFLLFAYDKNGLILIPEKEKTPEMICQWMRPVKPNAEQTCSIGVTSFQVEIDKVRLHSVSLSVEDGHRHMIDAEDLEEMVEWE
jgi:hypothetical protein